MGIHKISEYLQELDIVHDLIEPQSSDPLGKVNIPLENLGLKNDLEIVEVPNFNTWIPHSSLWQFFYSFDSKELENIDINKMNYQLPVGMISKSPDSDYSYYKYTFWLDSTESYLKIQEAIHVVGTILESITKNQ